jgi:hypothetical protein
MRLINYFNHQTYRNFLPFEHDSIDEQILEMFNTKLSITNITNKTPFDFSTK